MVYFDWMESKFQTYAGALTKSVIFVPVPYFSHNFFSKISINHVTLGETDLGEGPH